MVDPQPGHPFGDHPRHALVSGLEHRRVLLPDSGEGGDHEEAAVAELLVSARVVHEPVVLTLVHGGRVVTGAPRSRSQREAVLVVGELPVLDGQHRVVTQHREGDRATPVDVEPARVRRRLPVRQHVPPVRVLVRHGDTEVVGHDVDHHLQSRVRGRRQQRGPALLAAPVGVDPEGIGGVVPVVGSGGRSQDGRQVDRTHSEIAQVADQRGGVVQGEAPADLEPVRGGGRRHHRRLTVGVRRAGRWASGRSAARCSSTCPDRRGSAPPPSQLRADTPPK